MAIMTNPKVKHTFLSVAIMTVLIAVPTIVTPANAVTTGHLTSATTTFTRSFGNGIHIVVASWNVTSATITISDRTTHSINS